MAFLCCLGRGVGAGRGGVLIRFRFSARLAYNSAMSLVDNVLRGILPGKRPERAAIRLNGSLAAPKLRRVRRGENCLRFSSPVAENFEAQFADAIIDATERHATNHAAIETVNSTRLFPYSFDVAN